MLRIQFDRRARAIFLDFDLILSLFRTDSVNVNLSISSALISMVDIRKINKHYFNICIEVRYFTLTISSRAKLMYDK